MLTIFDESSKFPVAYPCLTMDTDTVTSFSSQFISLFGMPSYHSEKANHL